MKFLPETDQSLLIRTDFSDEALWKQVCEEVQRPVGEFRASVECISDREYEHLAVDQLPSLIAPGGFLAYIFLVDRTTLTHPEHPVLIVDLYGEVGRTFRCIPSEMWGVENNLSLANMDFSDFADNADPDGIFRGFDGMPDVSKLF